MKDIKKYVTIPEEEYLSLVEDSNFLDALTCAGVDNWEGYDEAVDIFESNQN